MYYKDTFNQKHMLTLCGPVYNGVNKSDMLSSLGIHTCIFTHAAKQCHHTCVAEHAVYLVEIFATWIYQLEESVIQGSPQNKASYSGCWGIIIMNADKDVSSKHQVLLKQNIVLMLQNIGSIKFAYCIACMPSLLSWTKVPLQVVSNVGWCQHWMCVSIRLHICRHHCIPKVPFPRWKGRWIVVRCELHYFM